MSYSVPYAHVVQGPAVVRPLAAPVVAPRRGINPIFPLCCLGLILFLIAATIVLALIPVYLRARGNYVYSQTVPYSALYRINNGTLPVGELTSGNCATIRKDQQNLAASNKGVSPSVPTASTCAVTGNTTLSRRRRQSGGPEGNLILITGFIPAARFCRRGQCLIRRAEIFIALLLDRGTFYLTLAGANGTLYVFSITCIQASFSPPINEGSSSSSGQGTGTGTGTGGGSSTGSTAALTNDIAVLNYALVLEHLEAYFYTLYQNMFNETDFTAAGFSSDTYSYFNLIMQHEDTHVRILTSVINQIGGTPVSDCTYNFGSVTNVTIYVSIARLLENTGAMAYAGAANGIADPILRELAATIGTVEARHASYLNKINGMDPFPSPFENATDPAVIIQAVKAFIVSCPFTITAPTIPYIGSSSFTGTVPTSNDTTVSPYTNAMYNNDINALNFALTAEHLESTFYNTFVANFTDTDFVNAGFPPMTSSYFIMIREYEATHVSFLTNIILQRAGTPVSYCSYNFNITNVTTFVQTSHLFENTGQKAYDGAINTITDPNLIQGAATIALVEARFAAFLNGLLGDIPFPDAIDPTLTPAQVVVALSAFQTCPFTPNLPVVLKPSNLNVNPNM